MACAVYCNLTPDGQRWNSWLANRQPKRVSVQAAIYHLNPQVWHTAMPQYGTHDVSTDEQTQTHNFMKRIIILWSKQPLIGIEVVPKLL